jgi:hypothetical protein
MANLLTYELAALVGRTYPAVQARITEEAVRRYCRAIGRPYDGRVPWLFLAHLGADRAPPVQRADGLSGRAHFYPLPLPVERLVIGGMAWEFGRRPALGDTLTLQGRLASLEEREGRDSGQMLISVLEITYTDARGDWVATQRTTRIHR